MTKKDRQGIGWKRLPMWAKLAMLVGTPAAVALMVLIGILTPPETMPLDEATRQAKNAAAEECGILRLGTGRSSDYACHSSVIVETCWSIYGDGASYRKSACPIRAIDEWNGIDQDARLTMFAQAELKMQQKREVRA